MGSIPMLMELRKIGIKFRYEGQWKCDKQEGLGTEIWTDGAKYEGEYSDGQKQGKGKLLWSDGSKYIGEFKGNNIEGTG